MTTWKRAPHILCGLTLLCLSLGAGEARAQAVEDDVVINEFTANSTLGREYVELLVVKPGGVDMRGWTISDIDAATGGSGTSVDEGSVTLPSEAYLSLVPQGTHVVIVLTQGSGPNTPGEDLSTADGDRKLVLVVGTTPLTTFAQMNLSTNDNIQLYAGPRATTTTLIDQVSSGTNPSYVPGATFGDNSGTTRADNIDGDNNPANNTSAGATSLPNGSDVRFVPAADTLAEFMNNDTGSRFFVEANSYGTPGAANSGVTENSLQPNPGTLQFSAATYTVSEDGGTATIGIARGGGISGAVSVRYATSNGSATDGADFSGVSGVISFADGETGTKTFTIPILNDATPNEPNETVNLSLSDLTGGATAGAQNTATLVIIDDDQPGTFAFEAAAFRAPEGSSAALVVTRSNGSSGAVAVPYSITGGTATSGEDFPAGFASGTVSFADRQTRATISIPLTDDGVIEDNETATLQLGDPGGGALIGAQGTTTLSIIEINRAPLLLLNEMKIDDIGADEPFEFIEVRGTPGALLTNISVLMIRGDSTAGIVYRAFNLSGNRIGTNGLLIIKSRSGGNSGFSSGTTIVTSTVLDVTNGLVNGAATFALAYNPPGAVVETQDLDADNNGTLELLPANVQFLDAIGYKNGAAADVVYGPEISVRGPSTTPTGTSDAPDDALEAITRFRDDLTPSSAAAWFGGALANTGTQTSNAYDTAQPNNLTANFPSGGIVTPGDINQLLNQAPVNALPPAQTLDEDTPLVLSAANNTLLAVADADSGDLPLTVELRPRNGRIAFNTGTNPDSSDLSGVTFLSGSTPTSVVKRLSGSRNALNAALRNLTFTPIRNFNGAANLQIFTNDNGNSGSGGAKTDVDALSITINPLNDAPTTSPDVLTTQANGAAVAVNVLRNDTSLPDGGETLTITGVTQPASGGGSVTIAPDGLSLNYTPGTTPGVYTFSYTINDGTPNSDATTTVRVTLQASGNASDVNASASRVLVTRAGFSRNRFDPNTYLQTVTLNNNSSASIDGPLFLVLDGLPAGITLDNRDGNTTQNPNAGSPYLNLQRTSFAAGESVTLTLRFTSTSGSPTYTTRVLAGGTP